MQRTPVTSQMICAIGYEAETETLEIEFNKGGRIYQYSGVQQGEHDALMSAESHGKYFLANIKDKYPTTRV